MISLKQLFYKRIFDIIVSFLGVLFFFIPVVILIVLSSFSCKSFGLFSQIRVGQNAKLFTIYKIRTMYNVEQPENLDLLDLDKFGISIKGDKRVTFLGRFLRQYKLDELPQLFNVLIGDMSLVGPRPDVIGYADCLEGDERMILAVKPGITGPATLAFKNEESLLSDSSDPMLYNNEVIWPKKIRLNMNYVQNWSFKNDLVYIYKTIFN